MHCAVLSTHLASVALGLLREAKNHEMITSTSSTVSMPVRNPQPGQAHRQVWRKYGSDHRKNAGGNLALWHGTSQVVTQLVA